MRYLPVQLSVRDRPVLVVGGGEVAARKAAVVARAGALLRVVAPRIGPELEGTLADPRHRCEARPFQVQDVEAMVLVVAATDDHAVNRAVSEAAQAAGVPVNVVDAPALCTFIMPALVDRSPLLVAVSSAADAPVLARTVRARIEAMLPARLGELASLLGSYRPRVKARFDTLVARRAFWESLVEGPVAELVFAGDLSAARAEIDRRLTNAGDNSGISVGRTVFLVGAGPGDPGCLTLAAQRGLQLAERIFHAEVPEGILDHARRDAPRQALAPTATAEQVAQALLAFLAESDRACWVVPGGLGARERTVAARLSAAGHQVTLADGLPTPP